MFIDPAFAQDATGAGPADFLSLTGPFLIVIGIMYFLVIRPQQKRASEHKKLIAALRRGDSVITAGGLHGKVTKVNDDELQIEIAEGVRVKLERSTITQVRAKGKPVKGE